MSYCRTGIVEGQEIKITFTDEKTAKSYSQEKVDKLAKEFLDYIRRVKPRKVDL